MSQRVRALEVAVGRPVLRRVRPVEVTRGGRGRACASPASFSGSSADLSDQLAPASAWAGAADHPRGQRYSLPTWALDGLATVADDVLALPCCARTRTTPSTSCAAGTAHGAVTATATPVPGCSSRPLGVMRYRPVCSPGFAARWSPDGPTPAALAAAPVVVYDEKDDLQDRAGCAGARRAATAPAAAPRPRHGGSSAAPSSWAWAGACCPTCSSTGWSPSSCAPLAPGRPPRRGLLDGSSGGWRQPVWTGVATAVADAARALRPPSALGPRL